jgi:phage/plasmid primase-like uncharacterized protein
VALARRIWTASWPIAGTRAEAYLRARKITADLLDAPLRYHPALIYHESFNWPPCKFPALVAAVTNHDGEITGIHRTFLDPDRNDKANLISPRRSLGAILGNGVRFGVIDEFAIIGEGIETVLSLKSVAPHLPMISALSAAHLAAWRPPPNLRRLVVAADNDEPGRNAAWRLSERMAGQCIDATTIIPFGADFNSELRKTSCENMRDRVERLIGLNAA